MIRIGEKLPNIHLPNQEDQMISLRSFKGTPLVIYFYPKNNTPGCTAEACSFRDSYEDFTTLGAMVIGISGDSVDSHKRVTKKRRLPFTLLSDSKREAEKAFGVKRNLFGLLPGRVTFIADQDGRIVDVFSSAIRPRAHITTALKSLMKIS